MPKPEQVENLFQRDIFSYDKSLLLLRLVRYYLPCRMSSCIFAIRETDRLVSKCSSLEWLEMGVTFYGNVHQEKTSSKINPFWVLNSEYEIYYFGLIFVITERHFCCWNTIWNYYPILNSLWFPESSHFGNSLWSEFFMGDKIWSKAESWLKILNRLEKICPKFLQSKFQSNLKFLKQNSNSQRLMENISKFYKSYMSKVLHDRF